MSFERECFDDTEGLFACASNKPCIGGGGKWACEN